MFTRIGVLLAAFFCFCINSVFAVEITCFDETFVRGDGAPVTEYVTFPGISGSAVLKIENGAADGVYEKVSSSIISINGVDIIGSDSFNQNLDYIEVPVTLLEGDNELGVQLKSRPGGRINIVIYQDVEAEGVEIIGPEGGTIIGRDGIILEIPENSISSSKIIRFSRISIDDYPNSTELKNNRQLLSLGRFEPDELVFANPVNIKFPLDIYVTPGTQLPIFTYEESAESFFDSEKECTVDDSGYSCLGEINHFSDNGVASTNFMGYLWSAGQAWYLPKEIASEGYRFPNNRNRNASSAEEIFKRSIYTGNGWVDLVA